MQNGISIFNLKNKDGSTATVAANNYDLACKTLGWLNADTILETQSFSQGIVISKRASPMITLNAKEFDSHYGRWLHNFSSL